MIKRPACLVQAAWWGLLSGLIDVAITTIKGFSTPIMNIGREYVWMAPLAALTFFLLPGLFFCLLGVFWKRMDPRTLTTFGCSVLASFSLLILIPRLHHVAALLLAAGIATQVTNWVKKRMDAFGILVRRTLPLMAALVLVLGITVQARQTLLERQRHAALPPASPRMPNVLFITLDTVRASHLSVYGYPRRTTPNLEALAAAGVVFERALSSASWTLPSHAGMFTGRAYHELSSDWTTPLDSRFATLAEVLKARGYVTAGFVSNLGYCSYETGLDRGFVHYEDYPVSLGQVASSSTLVRTIVDNFRLRRLLQNDQHISRKTADSLNNDVLQWLDRETTRPFFLFVNYFDAHDPYLPPAPFDTKFGNSRTHGRLSPLHRWLYDPAVDHQGMTEAAIQEEVAAYDGAVAYLDDRLGMLFSELKERNLWDNTLVIVTADHGEEFGEHHLFGHGSSLYLSSVHVPLIVSFPGRTPQAMRVETPVSLRDLPSTVVNMLDFEGKALFPGSTLARFWQSPSTVIGAHEEPLLSELNQTSGQPEWFPVSKGNMKSLVFRGLRYIKNGDGTEELYDYDHDPEERTNLAGMTGYRDSLEQLRSQMRSMVGE